MATSEARSNYEVFKQHQADLERDHPGQIVLLHDEKIISFWNDKGDAYQVGCEKYGLGKFSLQEIGTRPVDLGIIAAALL